MPAKRSASVIWELSEEGKVVVDVDVPLRPFGGTPSTGILLPKRDDTEPDGAVVDEQPAIKR